MNIPIIKRLNIFPILVVLKFRLRINQLSKSFDSDMQRH